MNLAEVGQSKLANRRRCCLTQVLLSDMGALAFQAACYKKNFVNKEKIMGWGLTLKQRNQREQAEEKRFIDEICDVILNGDLTDERFDNNAHTFMPSVRAKHKAPSNLKTGVQVMIKKNHIL